MRIIPDENQWSPYPAGRVLAACRDIPAGASFFAEFDAILASVAHERMLEMGTADTAHVRISEPYVAVEIDDLVSDGIPVAIGDEEPTKPATPPKNSKALFTGASRSEGMRW